MEKIYWISVIGNSQIVLFITCVASAFFLFLSFVGALVDEERPNYVKKYRIVSIILVVFTTLSLIFIPTEKQMYAIYGIGGTIDYIENNDKAKELPNKVIDALDLYLDGKTNK